MTFRYARTIRFHETDAAGVVYFANIAVLCHEAYEAALIEFGIDARQFFSAEGEIAVPIVHVSTDFLRPLHCGDLARVEGKAQQQDDHCFEVHYQVFCDLPEDQCQQHAANPRQVATALTRHICISTAARRRAPLPPTLLDWLSKQV